MPSAHRPRWRPAAILAATLLSGCLREPIDDDEPDGPVVDAEYYAFGFCAQRCYRLEECGLQAGVDRDTCKAQCTEDAVADLETDVCWEERIELRRCVQVKASCEYVVDEDLPLAGSACEDHVAALQTCEG
jgi:hypothetical protein